ncbi:MAG: AIR synthase-related protein, partial [Nitrososphaerales archaeon]
TKSAGIEGTSILAETFKDKLIELGEDLLNRASSMIEKISIVNEAVQAFATGCVHAMHDPTEGGILNGVYEMALASNLGFRIYEDKIPIDDITMKICHFLNIDPLRLISSGTLLMAVNPKDANKVSKALKSIGVKVSKIGEFTDRERVLIKRDGTEERIDSSITDELWKLLM